MSYHRYDPPEPRAHEMGRTSTGIAMLVGIAIACAGLTALYIFVLANIVAAVVQ